jgi:hypothetical protein
MYEEESDICNVTEDDESPLGGWSEAATPVFGLGSCGYLASRMSLLYLTFYYCAYAVS